MQGKLSSWETDLFAPLIARVSELTGKRYGAGEDDDVSMRVIADHGRTATFLIADGVMPSNEWRGYVLRRIMRRAMRHGRMLGLTEPFLWKTVAWVGERDGRGLSRRSSPSGRGSRTPCAARRSASPRRSTAACAASRSTPSRAEGAGPRPHVDGQFLFTLYDTYGFPRDLAEEILQDRGWQVTDETKQRVRGRDGGPARAGAGGRVHSAPPTRRESAAVYQRIGAELPPVEFVGYETLTSPARDPGDRARHPAGAARRPRARRSR